LRKRPRSKVVSLTVEDDGGEVQDLQIPDLRNLPEDSVIRDETRRAIISGIEELAQKHREILVMREITNMSYDEIAETLHVNVGTVKSRLARARMKLVEILVEKGTFPEGFRQKLREEVE
jgi:RNA polymerase sigma-70 factor (ECF subfamily)